MIGETITWVIILFAFIRFIISLINVLSPLYLPGNNKYSDGLVSILIPARNEEKNLPGLLSDLTNQNHSTIEILVYDDHSTDNTAEVVKKFNEKDGRVRLFPGKDLPGGWLGKNFACHNLARQAKGKHFLFLDADVRVSRDLVSNALNYIQAHNLDLLSIFPHQKMYSKGEWLTVPLMNWILLSLLPLILVRKSKRPSLSAANGQFMLFNAESYKPHNWHEQVRSNLVEDIVIIRKMKTLGMRTATLLGNEDVVCRMYTSYKEGINGFAKNIVEFFGGSILTALLFAFMVLGGVAVIFTGSVLQIILYIALILSIRIFNSFTSRQKVWRNLTLHIPQMFTCLVILFKGVKVRLSGRYVWKGRSTR